MTNNLSVLTELWRRVSAKLGVLLLLLMAGMGEMWGATYQVVTNWSELSNGDVVILANTGSSGSAKVMTSELDNGVRYKTADVTISSGKITTTSAMELRIKFNNDKTWCGFCVDETKGSYPSTKWLQDNGSNNQIALYSVNRSFENMGDFSNGSSKPWSWQCNAINTSKDYKVNLTNASATGRVLQFYTGPNFASSTLNTLAQCAIFKRSCNEPTLTVSPASKTASYGDGTFTVTATTNSSGTKKWESTNTSVATVSSSGVVTIVGAGTATINCTVGEDTSNGYCEKTAGCTLTVNAIAPTLSHNTSGKELTASNITSTSVTLSGAIVTNTGGKNITQYGFVAGTSSDVTWGTSGAKTTYTSSSIAVNTAFGSKTITGLTPNTTYYVKASAYNGSQRGYSGYITFTTLQQYTITYKKNDGSSTPDVTQTKEQDKSATLKDNSTFELPGKTLSRWDTQTGGDGTSYACGASYTGNADLILYAIWTPNDYTITLDNQGALSAGSTSISVTYYSNKNLTGTPAITLPERTGYTFGGYYTGKNGSGALIIDATGEVQTETEDEDDFYTDADKSWIHAGDKALYAQWTANTISLVLDKNNDDASGTTNGSATIKFDGTALESGTVHATRGGDYNLVGYFAEPACTNKVLTNTGVPVNYSGYVEDGKWVRTTSPTTLYAKWSLQTYDVTFNLHSHGGAIAKQEVESGEKATQPADPEEEDWRFLGWYKEESYANEFDFSTAITANTTIHAKWEAVTYSTALKAWCEPDIEITGDVHLTSVKDIYVYSTSTTDNLLRIKSDDLAGVTKLAIKYLDADNGDTEIASTSSLFRLCNDGTTNYNVAGGSQIDVSGSTTCDLTYSIRYTPDEYDAKHHYKLQVTMKRGTRDVKVVTHDLYGRSLPEEFAIVTKANDNKWYALPNTLATLEASARATVPVRITVDNTTTPTKAVYAPNTAVYKGEGRNAPTSNNYGVRMTDGTNHLQVSSTSTNNAMWLSATNSDAAQVWYLNSTDFQAYTLTIPSTGEKKLGIYGGNIGYYASPTSGPIYLLPIENKLVDNPAIVTEWGEHSVILDVDAQAAHSAQAHYGNDTPEKVSSLAQTLTSVKSSASKYNYTLTFSTTAFNGHEGDLLYIDWLDNDDEVICTSTISVPYIVASSGAMHALDGTKGNWEKREVHVLSCVTLTADAGSFASSAVTIGTLEIYPGATVKVTTGTLTATNLSLRYGWTRAGGKNYDVARLYITPSSATLKTTKVYADWYIDYDQYYPIAVPWNAATSQMSYKNSNSSATGGAVKFLYYDGASRAAGTGSPAAGENWKAYSPATLEPGKGYAMTAKRPTGKAFSIVRMPLSVPSEAWTTKGEQGSVGEEHKDQVAVTGWGNGTVEWYNMGWNFIGNPYMATFNGNDEGISGKLEYQNGGSIRYATIPTVDFQDFDQVPVTEANLKPASGFFVQANNASEQTVTFSSGKIIAPSAPARYVKAQESVPEQEVYISLSNGADKDQMGIIIGDSYTEAYEPNADLMKMLGEANTVKTYMHYGDWDMAYVAINTLLAKEWIPVIANIPAEGEYTYSLTNASVVDHLEGVYLIDYTTNKVTNLINENYTFTTEAGKQSGRFAINAIAGERKTPTDIDVINSGGDINSETPVKFIYREKVYIYNRGVIYDATGKRVKEVKE